MNIDDREKDIQIVCKAVLDNWLREYENWYDSCRFCEADQKSSGPSHKATCPVLIAKDLTAGYGDQNAGDQDKNMGSKRRIG